MPSTEIPWKRMRLAHCGALPRSSLDQEVYPSLRHFPRLSIFNLVIIPESEQTQVPMSLEKSGHGRFILCSLS